MTYTILMSILVAHFVGDWLLQTNWQAVNKSRNVLPLTIHVLTYTLVLATVMIWVVPIWWVVVNALAHFATDVWTSRLTSHYSVQGDRQRFFAVIGADQLIHYATLTGTWFLL